MKILLLAVSSSLRFIGMVVSGSLRLNTAGLGTTYGIDQGGAYTVFRETDYKREPTQEEVVLVVGFKLKLLGTRKWAHWLFQRLCILTTPFWSGFRGFRVKLWMVDLKTKKYLGIYRWAGTAKAQIYVDALTRVLKPLSVPGSVWYAIYPEKFERFINLHYQSA